MYINSGDSQLIIFTAKYHENASLFAYLDIVRYLLDIALNSRITQMSGFNFILDMRDSSWKKFDVKLLTKFLMFVQDHYPARLKRVLIIDAPKWVYIIIKAMKPFMKTKLANRIFFIELKRNIIHSFIIYFVINSLIIFGYKEKEKKKKNWRNTLRKRIYHKILEENFNMIMKNGSKKELK